MKFLGWMRHKFRENNKAPWKDVITGNNCFRLSTHSSLADTASYAESGYNTEFMRQLNKFQESSFPESSDNTEENLEDEMISQLFHGFLAIGTLGGEPAVDEPGTPTFGMSLENPIEEKAEVTQNDLNFISDELEKFFEAEAEGHDQPSARNSNANTIASTIKPLEGENAKEDIKTTIFPLQGYLFGSSIELPKTKIGATKEKASLGELFQRTNIQENSEFKCENKLMQTNPAHRSAKNPMKKLLKTIHSSSRFSTGGKTDSPSTKKKFQKIIQIFHRKVHPENSITEREINGKMKTAESTEPDYLGLISEKGNSSNVMSKRQIQCEIKGSDSARNGEHWIKTDAEYFVLEL
ncbi:PREDICTED: protein LAZY 1 isoform X2 [Tarenaya hassleriana]|uniref:protein LAZY 1 isoform X2 n=1 Tax=Tarenaya hassleriana TaxID=28532 RepID=UPI00053C6461|nr:PREDICTED: protein LAZY 1 isoform X2 [Tarenaya hassleriana]